VWRSHPFDWKDPFMTTQEWSHQDFPESTVIAPGMLTVEGQPFSRNVHVHLGVRYAAKSGRTLHLVVAQPSLDWATGEPAEIGAERFPLVVFVQGSGWGEQSLGSNLEPLISFARRGFVVAIVEYRPAAVAHFPAQVADTLTAVRWLIAHADDFGIDPARVALWGDSSGGHTVVMTAFTNGEPEFTDEPD
jgi:acetyl esterase/lipase